MARPVALVRALASPRARLLPALGARLAARPRLAARVLVLLRDLVPGSERSIVRPLLVRMDAELEVTVAEGFRLRVDTTEAIGRTLLTKGSWEPQITSLFADALKPGDVCVDVGANLGYFSVLAARHVGRQGRVYAVEPSPKACAALRSNLELNRLTNVTALEIGAGAAEADAVLRPERQSIRTKIATSRGRLRGTQSVPVRTVTAIVPPEERQRVRLIKIDVEGAEADVLRGVEGILAEGVRPIIVVEVHAGAIEEVVDLATSFGEKYGFVIRQLGAGVPESSGSLVSALEHAYESHLLLTPR